MDINSIPMVRIHWVDARDTETGWLDVKDILKAPLANCMEVGWMMVNNDEKIVIMRSWCRDKDDNNGGGATAIPKCWVKKIEYLQVTHADIRN